MRISEELKKYTEWLFGRLFYMLIIFLMTKMILGWLPLGRDSTDLNEFGGRSGFTIRIDALTGCEYLTMDGAINPRYDANGKQLGCKP